MRQYFLSSHKKKQYALALGDLVLISISLFVTYCIVSYSKEGYFSLELIWKRIHWLSLIFFLCHSTSLYVMGFYSTPRYWKGWALFPKLLISVSVSGGFAASLFYFFPRFLVGRLVLIIHLLILTSLLWLWRSLVAKLSMRMAKQLIMGIIGRYDALDSFVRQTFEHYDGQYVISSAYLVDNKDRKLFNPASGDCVKIFEDIESFVNASNIDLIVVDNGAALNSNQVKSLFSFRFNRGKNICDLSKMYESFTGKVPINYIDRQWFLSNQAFQSRPNSLYIKPKRVFDIIFSLLLLVLCLPVMVVTAILIKLETRGSLIYCQERLGRNRAHFKCYKFRTMRENAESETGPISSVKNDPRVTRLGEFLRATRIDELPQLINVLQGDLSFVGPRPIREHFANEFSETVPFYELRHTVKPGLTGWAQVHGCYAVPYGLEALQYELFYIQHMSLALDAHILFKTLKTIFQKEGK